MRVLISGASGGIGKETAREFLKRGYDLILISYKNNNQLNDICEEAKEKNRECHILGNTDLSNYNDCEKIFDYIRSNKIYPDILINNAGISHIGLLQDMDVSEWNNIISTNLNSVFYMSKLIIPIFLKNGGGRIVNISSVWGNVGASCEVAYSTSKGGINSFTKALAKELAPSNIKVNAIAFGYIDTKMNSFLSNEEKEELFTEIPMGRGGSLREAAEFIANISEQPDYLTGQIISLDGGWI